MKHVRVDVFNRDFFSASKTSMDHQYHWAVSSFYCLLRFFNNARNLVMDFISASWRVFRKRLQTGRLPFVYLLKDL